MGYRVDSEGRVIDEADAPRAERRVAVDRGGALSLRCTTTTPLRA